MMHCEVFGHNYDKKVVVAHETRQKVFYHIVRHLASHFPVVFC